MNEIEKHNQNVSIENSAPQLKRLAAAFIDSIIVGFVVQFFIDEKKVFALLTDMVAEINKGAESFSPELVERMTSLQIHLVLISMAVFFVINGFMLFKRGQTLGKMVMNIAIRDLNNQPVAFLRLVILRYVVQIPLRILQIPALLDLLFILIRKDRRSIHDLLAGTKVIDLSISVLPTHSDNISPTHFTA